MNHDFTVEQMLDRHALIKDAVADDVKDLLGGKTRAHAKYVAGVLRVAEAAQFALSTTVIQNGWAKAGIRPFNVVKMFENTRSPQLKEFDYKQFASSLTLTKMEGSVVSNGEVREDLFDVGRFPLDDRTNRLKLHPRTDYGEGFLRLSRTKIVNSPAWLQAEAKKKKKEEDNKKAEAAEKEKKKKERERNKRVRAEKVAESERKRRMTKKSNEELAEKRKNLYADENRMKIRSREFKDDCKCQMCMVSWSSFQMHGLNDDKKHHLEWKQCQSCDGWWCMFCNENIVAHEKACRLNK